MKSYSLKVLVFVLAAISCAHVYQQWKIRTDVVFYEDVVVGAPE